MTEQELNKQVVRDYFQKCWNENNLDAGYDLIKKDYEWQIHTDKVTQVKTHMQAELLMDLQTLMSRIFVYF